MLEKDFDVQEIGIKANHKKVFAFLSKPENLPRWTQAFSRADNQSATLLTPHGKLEIGLESITEERFGIVDWKMTMPDGSVGKAYSRVSENGDDCIYSFTLLAPPLPQAEIEGALEAQKILLAQELLDLKELMERK